MIIIFPIDLWVIDLFLLLTYKWFLPNSIIKRMISLNDQGLSKIWYQTFWHTFCSCLICSTRNRIWHIIQSLENSKKILINVTESLNYLQILSSIYLPFAEKKNLHNDGPNHLFLIALPIYGLLCRWDNPKLFLWDRETQ